LLTEIISGKGTAFGEKKKEQMKAPDFHFSLKTTLVKSIVFFVSRPNFTF
jgi:hypothetical protein